jgi:hypothetical protein
MAADPFRYAKLVSPCILSFPSFSTLVGCRSCLKPTFVHFFKLHFRKVCYCSCFSLAYRCFFKAYRSHQLTRTPYSLNGYGGFSSMIISMARATSVHPNFCSRQPGRLSFSASGNSLAILKEMAKRIVSEKSKSRLS